MTLKLPSVNHQSNSTLKKKLCSLLAIPFLLLFIAVQGYAQGTWTPVAANCPGPSGGVMLLLSDGTVICKSFSGGTDGIGTFWYKLTPDSLGSYVNGKWSQIAAMQNSRLYFSSQLLKDGRVYVAGGEYGTGGSAGEIYNPLTNTWTPLPAIGSFVSDANSAILPDGRVMQALVSGTLKPTKIYNPVTNTFVTGPNCVGIHNESAWMKLPDNSILFVDRNTKNSERYIPATNQWIADATVPVSLYDPYGLETGSAFLLPDGRAWFIGSLGHTAYYTPTGTTAPGTWAAGPDIPNAQGTPDAPGAMMVNGKILCSVSPIPTSSNHFPTPTSFYEFNYLTNSFNRINAPGGGLTANVSSYVTNMVDLPDGSVLFSYFDSTKFYVYKPTGTPVASGKPTIASVKKNVGTKTYTITGTLFNGISEGACYGDDWQMATNYPIVRLTLGAKVYYARTYNWNSTGVMRGSAPDTAQFTLPKGLPKGQTFSLSVVANGISSNPVIFPQPAFADEQTPVYAGNDESNISSSEIKATKIFPNPAKDQTTVQFVLDKPSYVSMKIVDMGGKELQTVINSNLQQGSHNTIIHTNRLTAGIYYVQIITAYKTENLKLIVQ